MKNICCPLLLLWLLGGASVSAQDSRFAPKGQQIPVPDCLNMRGLWEGGYTPCGPEDHRIWLQDITHWRRERRIRIGYESVFSTIRSRANTRSGAIWRTCASVMAVSTRC